MIEPNTTADPIEQASTPDAAESAAPESAPMETMDADRPEAPTHTVEEIAVAAEEAVLAPAASSSFESAATLVLQDPWLGRVVGGVPQLDPKEIGAATNDWAPGAVVRFDGPDGAALGFGLYDPDNNCLRVLPLQAQETYQNLDFSFFRRRVRRALAWRKRLGLVSAESAYRLVNGEGDGLAGFTVDVYAGHVLIATYSNALLAFTRLLADAIAKDLQPLSIIAKVHPTGETPTGRVDYQLLSAEPPPRQVVVEEDDARYEVHLLGGVNTGLFCDMRDVRRALRQVVAGQRVLNTFAYTGSFSIVSALADAKSVTTVEFAGGVVEWAKTNFALNDLPTDQRRFKFVKDDVFDFLKSARRRQDEYDVIVLDPPSTTSAPGRRWFLKSDYDRLIGHALRVLAPGGLLIVAANTISSRPEGIETQIKQAARDVGRRLRLIDSFGLPADFPTQMIHPQSRYLKCFFALAE